MYSRCLRSAYVKNVLYCSLLLLTIDLTDAFCSEHFWWDQVHDTCIDCTICDEQSIVLRPCQPHQDTICGTLSDLELELDWLTSTHERTVSITFNFMLFFHIWYTIKLIFR